MNRGLIHAAVIAGLLCCVAGARADTLTIGSPGPAFPVNSIPFGSYSGNALSGTTTVYQQIYSASEFPGTIDITGISFLEAPTSTSNGIVPGIYTLSFLTTSIPVGGLIGCTLLTCNLGGAVPEPFFTGSLPASTSGTPPELTIPVSVGGAPFVYNPASGNLLLYVVAIDQPPGANLATFESDSSGNLMSRAYWVVGTNATNPDGNALVTQFAYTAMPVAEPATWALFAAGLLVLGAVRGWPLTRSMRTRRGGAGPA
jgi:hypothetical protein